MFDSTKEAVVVSIFTIVLLIWFSWLYIESGFSVFISAVIMTILSMIAGMIVENEK